MRKASFFATLLAGAASSVSAVPCASTKVVKQAGGGDCTTIQACVNLIPATLTGNFCVDIQDSATYSEQVTIQGKDPTAAGYQIIIGTTTGVQNPIVNPPILSTAAFQVLNASVTLSNIAIIPTNPVSYGVLASSAYVTISSVNVNSGGKISAAGISISSWSTVSYSNVTVQAAHGLYASGTSDLVIGSIITSNSSSYNALYFNGVSFSTITSSYISNPPGYGAYLINSNNNSIGFSTITSHNGSGNGATIYLLTSSSNTVTRSYVENWVADVISFAAGSSYDTISQSTANLTNAGGQDVIHIFNGASFNTVTGSVLNANNGYGAFIQGNFNTIAQTTMTVNAYGERALTFWVASSNTITQCYISNQSDTAVDFANGSNYNIIGQSVIIGGPTGNPGPSGIDLTGGAYNTIVQSYIMHPAGYGAIIGGTNNTIDRSTITSPATGYSGLLFGYGSATNTVTNSYVQGSTAVYITNSQGATINSSVLVATNTTGYGLRLANGSVNLSLSSDTIIGGPQGAGIFLDVNNAGTISLSSDIVQGSMFGLNIATQTAGASISIASMTFQSLPAGTTAINFLGGTFISTFSNVNFADPNIAVNVNASPLSAGSRITMSAPAGPRAGPGATNDPGNFVYWPSYLTNALPSSCGVGFNVKQDGSQNFTTIQAAVNALPPSLSNTTCVVIRDTNTYAEAVTIQGFANNGYQLKIMSDPSFVSSAPVVSPPASSNAAFMIQNTSVTLQNVAILATNSMPYGIQISSAYVTLSSVNVNGGANITTAGIALNNWGTVSYSTAVVAMPYSVPAAHALYINGSGNIVSYSQVTSNSPEVTYDALALDGASSNTITHCNIFKSYGTGLLLTNNAYNNTINQSTMATNHTGAYSGLFINGASSNTITQSTIQGGLGALLYNANSNTISQSVLTTNGFNSALLINGSSSNTITQCAMSYPAVINSPSNNNTISQSTMASHSNVNALYIAGMFNVVTQSIISHSAGNGAFLDVGSNGSSISQSVITSGASGYSALVIAGSSATISQSLISNVSGMGAQLASGANFNTISQSTITSNAAGLPALYMSNVSSDTVSNCYVQGSTAVYVLGSTSTVINSSVLVATNTTGNGLWLTGGSVNLSLSSNTITGGTQGAGIYLDLNNAGAITLSSNTIQGARFGLDIATQAAGASLSIASMTFQSLPAGTTAINFLGGTFISTFSNVNFADPNIAVNVNALALSAGTRITMRAPSGPRAGAAFADDPNKVVYWPDGPVVGLPAGCGAGYKIKKDGSQDFTTIQAAVNALPPTLSTTTCIVVQDAQTYNEQVAVQGIANNGFQLQIMADPALSQQPTISPPASSTAAFQISNASVTISGFRITPTNPISFGIQASSAYVTISSVNVIDVSSNIAIAGIAISSWSAIAYSSVTVQTANGIYLSGTGNIIAYTSAISSVTTFTVPGHPPPSTGYALYLNGAASTTVNQSYFYNPEGIATFILSANNTLVIQSTIASNSNGSWGISSLYVSNGYSNTILQSYISNLDGTAVILDLGSSNSSIIQSTLTSSHNGLSALYIFGASNTVSQSYISNSGWAGVALYGGATANLIRQSTITSIDLGILSAGAYNTFIQDSFYSQLGPSIEIFGNNNLISQSTLYSGSTIYASLAIGTGSSNTITQSYISAPLGLGVEAYGSTDTVISNSNIQGSTGASLADNFNFSLTSNTIVGASQGYGVYLDVNNSGSLVLSSDSIQGALFGINISTQAAGANLSISSVTFQSMPAGATAVNFLGGTFISTFSNVNFADPNIAVNVNGSSLGSGSRITLLAAVGLKAGPTFENDPNNQVDWIGTVFPVQGQPGVPTGTTLGVSSITWTWTTAPNATGYKVFRASSPATVVGTVASPPFSDAGLAANTAYGIAVAATNATGQTPLSFSATAYTLAAPPAGTAAAMIGSTFAAISWGLNSNPPATRAEVQRSTDNALFTDFFVGIPPGSPPGLTDYGLLGCTKYYYRVRDFNGNGIATAFDNTLSFTTLASTPSPPTGLTADSLPGNRIALAWNPSPTEGIAQYRLYTDSGTGTFDYSIPWVSFSSAAASFTTPVLVSSAAYKFQLRAVHRCGVEETTGVFATAASISTPAKVRAAVRAPASGQRVKGNNVSVVAELTSGTFDQASQVVFQYKVSASTAWANIPAANPAAHPNPAPQGPYVVEWDANAAGAANGLGSYDLRAVAVGIDGSSDTAPSAATISIAPPGALSSDYDINENVAGNQITKEQIVSNSVPNVIQVQGVSANDLETKISLPANAFALAGSTVSVTVLTNVVVATSAPSGSSSVGAPITINVGGAATTLLAPGLTAALTFSYPSAVDKPENLRVYTLDPVVGWTALEAGGISASSRTVAGLTTHFSTFAVFLGVGGAQTNLNGARAYPVPYKPTGGNPNEGKPFVPGDLTTGVIFDRLPATVSIRIYTLTGRLVAKIDTVAGGGGIQWDAKNMDGRDVASGSYLAVLSSPGLPSTVRKLMIIR